MGKKERDNLFYRNLSTKKENDEFMKGFRMAAGTPIRTSYSRALKLSKKPFNSLNPAELGYVANAVNNKLSKKNGMLDAAQIYANVDFFHDKNVKLEVGKALIKDAAKNTNQKYIASVEGFIEENNYSFGTGNSLDKIIHSVKAQSGAVRKINKTSIALVLAGFLFSSYNITGNVIGVSASSGKFVGALLFSVGLIWMTVSIKKETARFTSTSSNI